MAIYVVVGLPASGKTTWIKKRAKYTDRVFLFDDQFPIDEESGRRYWWEKGIQRFWDTTPMDSGTICSAIGRMLFSIDLAMSDTQPSLIKIRAKDIFIEGPFLGRLERRLLVDFLRASMGKRPARSRHVLTCCVMPVDVIESLLRNDKRGNDAVPTFVIRDQMSKFEQPSLLEGWDNIVQIPIIDITCA